METFKNVEKEYLTEMLTDIELAQDAIDNDMFYTRDPADAATLLCFGAKLIKIRFVKEAMFAKRIHRRLVMFGFEHNKECFRALISAKSDIRSSKVVTNVNIGEWLNYFRMLKTTINSSF